MQNGHPDRQALLIDADDTLWETTVHFEHAIQQFIARLNHQSLSPQEVRLFLNQVERETIQERGYGAHSFAHSLTKCFERLAAEPVTPELHEFIAGFAHRIASSPIHPIPGVPETLSYLRRRGHHLIMMTKGDVHEQSGKIERSGIKEYFAAVEIVREKKTAAYKNVVAKYELALQTTWMIGNSPRSDINPALAAGINAVFVPNEHTWVLEKEEFVTQSSDGRFLKVQRFTDLRKHF